MKSTFLDSGASAAPKTFGLVVRFVRNDPFFLKFKNQLKLAIGSQSSYFASLEVHEENTVRELYKFIYPHFGLEEEVHIMTDALFTPLMPEALSGEYLGRLFKKIPNIRPDRVRMVYILPHKQRDLTEVSSLQLIHTKFRG